MLWWAPVMTEVPPQRFASSSMALQYQYCGMPRPPYSLGIRHSEESTFTERVDRSVLGLLDGDHHNGTEMFIENFPEPL